MRDFLQFSHFVASKLTCCHCGCRAVAGQIGGRRDYAKTRTQVATSQRQTRQVQTRLCKRVAEYATCSVAGVYANTSRNVAASDATTKCKSGRDPKTRNVARQTRQGRHYEDANTSRNVAASDAIETQTREYANRGANISRNVAASKATSNVAASDAIAASDATDTRRRLATSPLTRNQVATSQRQTRLREDAAQTRNVSACSVRRDRGRRDYAKTRASHKSQRRSVRRETTRRREHKSQRRSVRRDTRRRRPNVDVWQTHT